MSFNFGTTAITAPAAPSRFSFGASTPTPANGAGGSSSFSSFGGGTPTPTPASSGFSFGGTTAATPAPAAGGGGFSFGGAPTAAAPAAGGGGFSFGGAAAATPAPAAGGGGFSFGGATTAAAPASSGGFSFGGVTTAPATAPASSSGFSFGAAAAAPTTTPSLFGGATGGGGTTSLFGGSAFGTPAATTTPAFGGFNTGFGTQPQQQAQQQQQAMPAQPAIKLETLFDALPADVKKNITDFHKVLKDEDQSDAFLRSVSARKLDALNGNLDQLEQDVLLRRNLQDRQATAVHHVRKDVKHLIHQVDTATLNLRSMSGESTSQRFYGIMRRVEMPSPYYWELLDNFEARMEQLKSQIESVESEFKPLYDKQRRGSTHASDAAANLGNVDPALLQQILVSQNAALIQVAAHVAEVHEKTDEMRQAFIRKMKDDLRKHGDTNLAAFKNPFDKKKKNSAARESDIDNIRFKTSVVPTIVATQQQQQQPAVAAPATGGFSGFGTTATTTGTTGFGGFSQTPATSGSLFGGGLTATTTAPAPAASTGSGGFNFGGGTPTANNAAAPKQVSFSLGGTTTPAPTVSTGAASGGFSFGAPATPAPGAVGTPTTAAVAAPGGFGAVGSSFMPVSTPAFGAGDKRSASGAGSKSGGLRSRQKKR